MEPLKVLSLGAGVQSSTIALMVAEGELERPDFAVFADTHCEPEAVYVWLEWLKPRLPFPVHTVSAGDLRQELHQAARGESGAYGRPPFFVRNQDGSAGKLRRQCTQDYKIDPIRRFIKEALGYQFRRRMPKEVVVEQWIGISTDELRRAKQARELWIENRWPLLEAKMSRTACLAWLKRHGYPFPVKSSCTFCPFHSNSEWRWLKVHDPQG